MKVTKEIVENVAKLARLGLTDTEKTKFTGQLSAILDYADSLKQLDTKNVPPTTHVIPVGNVMREDVCIPFTNTKSIIANAPSAADNMFRVPKIMD